MRQVNPAISESKTGRSG